VGMHGFHFVVPPISLKALAPVISLLYYIVQTATFSFFVSEIERT